jgi:hypothetical protein
MRRCSVFVELDREWPEKEIKSHRARFDVARFLRLLSCLCCATFTFIFL